MMSREIRIMEKEQPPIRAIMPGRVYRNEAISSRSYCMFHQVDGIYVDTDVSSGTTYWYMVNATDGTSIYQDSPDDLQVPVGIT